MRKFDLKFISIFLIIYSNLDTVQSFSQISKVENNSLINENVDKTKPKKLKLQQDFYLIGKGDVISLKVIGAEELNMQIRILNDGNATLPLVGVKKIDGLTPIN